MPTLSKPKRYTRDPERPLLCQTVAEHYETWLGLARLGQLDGQGDHHSPAFAPQRKTARAWSGLRYCARPPFAMERLRKAGSEHRPKRVMATNLEKPRPTGRV